MSRQVSNYAACCSHMQIFSTVLRVKSRHVRKQVKHETVVATYKWTVIWGRKRQPGPPTVVVIRLVSFTEFCETISTIFHGTVGTTATWHRQQSIWGVFFHKTNCTTRWHDILWKMNIHITHSISSVLGLLFVYAFVEILPFWHDISHRSEQVTHNLYKKLARWTRSTELRPGTSGN